MFSNHEHLQQKVVHSTTQDDHGSTDGERALLSVVIFTSGELTPTKEQFFGRLARDSDIDLKAIFVDEYQRPRRSLPVRVVRQFRKQGIGWVPYKVRSVFETVVRTSALRIYDRLHNRSSKPLTYNEFSRSNGVPVHRVADIHSQDSLDLIRETRPDLVVIYGGRILRSDVTQIPARGTLNLHKRKVPDFRGGGAVGYWEFLKKADEIGITIHFAEEKVDAGAVLAETTIPFEPCETLESIGIKAAIVGADLYYRVILDFALGHVEGKPQEKSDAKTYRLDSEVREDRLRRNLQRQMAKQMGLAKGLRDRLAWFRVSLQYAALLPFLLRKRRKLEQEGRAPICIRYYHAVANRRLNHLCIPLELFVKQLEFIRRYFPIISLDEAVCRLRSGQNSEIAFAITFDDGYQENQWAIDYARFHGIPACFFVSSGHIADGSAFAHDLRKGFTDAHPMSADQCRGLLKGPLIIGSHGVYHEDFGALQDDKIEWAMRRSKEMLTEMIGETPRHFSFPFGLRNNICKHAVAMAKEYYDYYYSAYGGYCYPHAGERHFCRFPNPISLIHLLSLMDGYTGLKDVMRGDGWSQKSHHLPPC